MAAGGPTEVSQEELDELMRQYDELTKSNALLEMENEVFESYLTRHHHVSVVAPARSQVDTTSRARACCSTRMMWTGRVTTDMIHSARCGEEGGERAAQLQT